MKTLVVSIKQETSLDICNLLFLSIITFFLIVHIEISFANSPVDSEKISLTSSQIETLNLCRKPEGMKTVLYSSIKEEIYADYAKHLRYENACTIEKNYKNMLLKNLIFMNPYDSEQELMKRNARIKFFDAECKRYRGMIYESLVQLQDLDPSMAYLSDHVISHIVQELFK